jgi:hypothetical protein
VFIPQIAYPTYTLTSSTDGGSAQIVLSIGREAELIGPEGSDSLARLLVDALGAITGAPVIVTKSSLSQAEFV